MEGTSATLLLASEHVLQSGRHVGDLLFSHFLKRNISESNGVDNIAEALTNIARIFLEGPNHFWEETINEIVKCLGLIRRKNPFRLNDVLCHEALAGRFASLVVPVRILRQPEIVRLGRISIAILDVSEAVLDLLRRVGGLCSAN